ncbi:MAG TPA: amino acid ABC transporter permease [Candidatus Ornithomonoglobus intestinigallinarum]|uniref:Amino acid ABC transporter permease n=1 Tax=Candidatus Ornithomonoglobus intestinigallinarum TaxID=2840894 RepID=A0A9D1H280_9FIRM|nr:amino acid ABC transporter permease [Candidatus Ornithomonoglobus intestinigallinarum]
MDKFMEVFGSLTSGFGLNCIIFAATLVMAVPLGLIVAFGSMSEFKPLKWLTKTFVWIIRGTPLMLQIFIVLYAPGLLFDIPMRSRMTAVIIAFVINYAAYFSEIYRGGIESIPVGQYEAGQVLGLTKRQVFSKIVLFQVIKRIVPPMGNEIITLVKDTSLARAVAITEIIMSAERFTKEGLIMPLFSTGLYFLAINGLLTLLFGYIEKRLNYYKG